MKLSRKQNYKRQGQQIVRGCLFEAIAIDLDIPARNKFDLSILCRSV